MQSLTHFGHFSSTLTSSTGPTWLGRWWSSSWSVLWPHWGSLGSEQALMGPYPILIVLVLFPLYFYSSYSLHQVIIRTIEKSIWYIFYFVCIICPSFTINIKYSLNDMKCTQNISIVNTNSNCTIFGSIHSSFLSIHSPFRFWFPAFNDEVAQDKPDDTVDTR